MSIPKYLFLILIGFLFSSFVWGTSAKQANIILFLVDDMGLMDTSVPMLLDDEGHLTNHPLNEWYRTPSMEKLADHGIRYSTFYACSVCSPTRVSILSGQQAARHGTTAWMPAGDRGEFSPPDWNSSGLDSSSVTLPKLLRSNGYKTLMVGKAHFGSSAEDIGFDVGIGGAHFGHPGSYSGIRGFGALLDPPDHAVPDLEKYHGKDIHLTEALTIEAKDQITQSVKEKKPFFLYMSHYAVHAPFEPDPRFVDHYQGKNEHAKAFASLIEGMDKSLGDLIDHLDTLGIAEDTLILFLGDNGSDAPLGKWIGTDWASSAPLRGRKGTAYEGGIRVPFIVAWGKVNPQNKNQIRLPIKQASVQTQLGSILDIFPTVLEVANIPNPVEHILDGSSLVSQFLGQKDSPRKDRYLVHFPHKHRNSYFTTWRNGSLKLIYYYNPEASDQPSYELFDFKKDPYEKHNLAELEPEKLRTMIREMAVELKRYDARYPINVTGETLNIQGE